jgi:hypothetical protein
VRVAAAVEGIVIRRHFTVVRFAIGVALVLAVALEICPVVRSQDAPPQTPPPSLGDIARKNREEKTTKDKSQAAPAKTFTNDDVISGKSGGLLGASVPSMTGNHGAQSGSAFEKAIANMDDAIQKLNELGAMDHDTLFKTATQGIIVDFPGRKEWETRMIAARQNYVVHGRELLQSTKALFMDAKALHDAQPNLSEDDPRVKGFVAKVQTKMKDAERMEGDFKAVAEEGRERAAKAAGIN